MLVPVAVTMISCSSPAGAAFAAVVACWAARGALRPPVNTAIANNLEAEGHLFSTVLLPQKIVVKQISCCDRTGNESPIEDQL
jgi:hypothetical protein